MADNLGTDEYDEMFCGIGIQPCVDCSLQCYLTKNVDSEILEEKAT
jgi:hypothetical protein